MQSILKPTLYEQDYDLWLQTQVAYLRAGLLSEIDFINLVEELESMSNRQRRELQSRLQTLLAHILKRKYVDSPYDYNGWDRTIREQRKELKLLLKHSPSLRNYFVEVFPEAWQDAIAEVRDEYSKTEFPETCFFDIDVDTVLTQKFFD
ncbi:DUF29 domain-containing protein [Pseudanabaena sp. PCC 6802]|uniref:DUF29 domain-containing protein n=1 Tax=Pseudanabaena sp. PCC 6802 TaxID=118173 RepID=UPI00034B3750|nr:DUF29 domain-containing protein [Pseudanabaena sp. PCC 6802]